MSVAFAGLAADMICDGCSGFRMLMTRIPAGLEKSAYARVAVLFVTTRLKPPVIVAVIVSDCGSRTSVFRSHVPLEQPFSNATHTALPTVAIASGCASGPSLRVVRAIGAPAVEYAVTVPNAPRAKG